MRSTAKTVAAGKKKNQNSDYYDKNTRLWCMLFVAVSLYSAIWIFTSTQIDVTVIQKLPPQLSSRSGPSKQKRSSSSSRRNSTTIATTTNKENTTTKNATETKTDDVGSDYDNDNEKKFISYQLHYDKPYDITFGHNTKCVVGVKTNKWGRKPIRRAALTYPFRKILDVTTTVQTNLKIISIGDSVGMQFHELLEEALQPPTTTSTSIITTVADAEDALLQSNNYRVVYQNAWGDHETVSVSAPVDGGGALAALRMTGLLLEEGRGQPPPNAGPNKKNGAGGWLPEHVQQILNHTYNTVTTNTTNTTRTAKTKAVESFDAMIFRIPHGWLSLNLITRERLEASLLLARELFGINTAIVQTLFLNNNVKTIDDLIELDKTNDMISNLVEASWERSDLPDLMLMDFGGWTDKLTNLNARLAGMDQSAANYTLERLGCAIFPPSIAMSCVDQVNPGSCTCTRNMISIDGMHFCMESIGGRTIGAIACLLQCSLFPSQYNDDNDKVKLLRRCQKHCNDQFMSLSEASFLSTTGITLT